MNLMTAKTGSIMATNSSILELKQVEKYVVDEDAALVILEEMYAKICCEDQTLRTFRRSLGFGHYIRRTLIPLLMSTKREAIVELTMRLLANLTLPVECLYSVEIMSRTEAGRKNVAEIAAMLTVTKRSFANVQAIRAIVDYMRLILERDSRLSPANCANLNNCLIVFRNVLHIPDMDRHLSAHSPAAFRNSEPWLECAALQNQILYNLFALSIDKLLIHLMSCTQREHFVVAMVQLIALMYKDQSIGTLQTLLSSWFDASMSDSSEDFESNTTPMKATSGNSSPMLTSDSSDNGGNPIKPGVVCASAPVANDENENKIEHSANQQQTNLANETSSDDAIVRPTKHCKPMVDSDSVIDYIDPGSRKNSVSSNNGNLTSSTSSTDARKKSLFSEMSDCGYGTQVESIGRPEIVLTTSSNEDEQPQQFHQHQKPPATNQKQRYNAVNNPRSAIAKNDKKEWRRKKLVKRSKTSFINMSGVVMHHGPSDAAISNILKEFTVDFLLKCYGYLVKGLYMQLLTNTEPDSDIDTSHFFWLLTYFLRLTAQIELDLEHVKHALSLGIISFLTFEGVSLSEELALLLEQEGVDTRSCVRRLHLVVTAIKEYLQTLDCFKRIGHLSTDDMTHLHKLSLQITDLTGLQCLFVMLLRNYNAKIHTKQYLQDIIVTNHILLVLLDEVSQYNDYRGSMKMKGHIEQFATIEVMQQYGLLLTYYQENGEFVNDCIFTMMHHIGGDIGQVALLYQPNILKTFSKIFETEYDLCDDWSDLIEYIIHKFLNTPQQSALAMPRFSLADPTLVLQPKVTSACSSGKTAELIQSTVWTKEETDSLYWYYVQSRRTEDMIGTTIQLYAKNDRCVKTRIAVIQQLLLQDIITLLEYDDLMAAEAVPCDDKPAAATSPRSSATDESGVCLEKCSADDLEATADEGDWDTNKATLGVARSLVYDDIQMLKQRIQADGKGAAMQWLQQTLIDSCYVKLLLKKSIRCEVIDESRGAMEPIPYHYSLKRQAIPVVPWNTEQSVVHLYPPFMLLLHKLGLHLPADSGKAFVRIPAFWTADMLFNVAEKLGAIDPNTLRFDKRELHHDAFASAIDSQQVQHRSMCAKDTTYGVHRCHSMIRFTPDPLTQYSSDSGNRAARNAPRSMARTSGEMGASLARRGSADLAGGAETSASPSDANAKRSEAAEAQTSAITSESCPASITVKSANAKGSTNANGADDAQLPVDRDTANSSMVDRCVHSSGRLPVLQESIDEDVDDELDGINGGSRTAGAQHLMAIGLNETESLTTMALNTCETASVVSDSTHIYDLYVSDGEDA